jgi:hypothetical protein
VLQKTARLSSDNFRASNTDSSLPFGDIVSTTASTSWCSPSTTNVNTPHADVALLAEAESCVSFRLIRDAGMGSACNVQHRFAMCRSAGGRRLPLEEEEWFIPLSSFTDSAVLVWPVKVEDVKGHKMLSFSSGLTRPRLIGIFDWNEMVVAEYTWRSPLWQTMTIGQHDKLITVAIRPFLGQERVSFGKAPS